MRSFVAVSLVVAIVVSPLAAAPAPASETATAADLIRSGQRAVGEVVKVAQRDAVLSPAAADAKPFWEAIKVLHDELAKAETALTLESETFFTSLAVASAATQQAGVALTMNAGTDAGVAESMERLASIVDALDTNYSKEVARLAGGGELTPEERRQLDELKAKQGELEEKLTAVEKQAGANDARIKEGVDKIRESSRKIRNARYQTRDFVNAMIAARMMSGWIWGWHWWWGPWGYWGPGWININIIVWDDWIGAVPYDWALVETAIDVADLDLEAIAFEVDGLAEVESWLDAGDFGLEEGDLIEWTDDLALGWDEVESDLGLEVLDGFESNFDSMPFEDGFAIDTFDDFGGYDDFGGGFDDFGYWD